MSDRGLLRSLGAYGWAAAVLACLVVYANSLDNDYHYDDEHSLERNINIRSLDNIPAFFGEDGPLYFSVDPDKGMYRPLLLTTYALNFWIHGFDVAGYHWVNILLHAVNAALVWWLVRLLGGGYGQALAGGLLFALHPLASEPVNYLSSRSESLLGLFFLLSTACYFKATSFNATNFNENRAAWAWQAASWGALGLGLLCKSTAVVLPAVLLAWELLAGGRGGWRQRLSRHLPYWGLALAYVGWIQHIRFLPQSLAQDVREGTVQALTQLKAFAYYLYLLGAPLKLNVEHQFFEQQVFDPWLSGAVGLLALSWAAVLGLLYRRGRRLAVWLSAWAVCTLAPVMVVPLNILVNERRLYLACAALCIGLAFVLVRGRLWPALALAAVFGLVTVQRNEIWANDFSLWQDSVAKAPYMPRSNLYLGNAHVEAAGIAADPATAQRHWDAALAYYRHVIRWDRRRDLALRALNNIGSIHFVLGRYDQALQAFEQAVAEDPSYADALVGLGNIYQVKARQARQRQVARSLLEKAAAYYEGAIRLSPNHYQAHSNLGLMYVALEAYDKALKAYEQAYRLNPNDALVLSNVGNLYRTLGQEQARAGQDPGAHWQRAAQFYRLALKAPQTTHQTRQGVVEALRQVEALLGGDG